MSTATPIKLGAEILPSGTVVDGKFQVIESIGTGGFARVYRARQVTIERPVALKILNAFPDADAQRGNTARFLQEARVAAQIQHPNVVAIYDFGVFEDRPYIAMELLEGCDLRDLLRQEGPLEPARVVGLMLDVLDALGKGHDKGIVHKDLKPANLFLHDIGRRSESMRILDFGIARVQHSTAMTQSQQVLGTPRYYAPEYVRHHLVTPSLDVYQMALILVEALIAEPMVAINDPFLCMMRHCMGQIPLPVPLLESPLGPVLLQALATDHTRRYKDAHVFRDALERVDVSAMGRFSAEVPRCYMCDVRHVGGRLTVPPQSIISAEAIRGEAGFAPNSGSGPMLRPPVAAAAAAAPLTVVTPGPQTAPKAIAAAISGAQPSYRAHEATSIMEAIDPAAPRPAAAVTVTPPQAEEAPTPSTPFAMLAAEADVVRPGQAGRSGLIVLPPSAEAARPTSPELAAVQRPTPNPALPPSPEPLPPPPMVPALATTTLEAPPAPGSSRTLMLAVGLGAAVLLIATLCVAALVMMDSGAPAGKPLQASDPSKGSGLGSASATVGSLEGQEGGDPAGDEAGTPEGGDGPAVEGEGEGGSPGEGEGEGEGEGMEMVIEEPASAAEAPGTAPAAPRTAPAGSAATPRRGEGKKGGGGGAIPFLPKIGGK